MNTRTDGPFFTFQLWTHRSGGQFNFHDLTRAEFDALPGAVEYVEAHDHHPARWDKKFTIGQGTLSQIDICWITHEAPAPLHSEPSQDLSEILIQTAIVAA